MYERFYGLREKPFSKTPDPRFLYLGRAHREALARLLFAVEERDPALLTGGIGCGKTTLSRALMDQLDGSFKIILMINPRLSPLEFLRALARHLGIGEPSDYKTDLLEQIGEVLYGLHQKKICPVLIIDEAQLIPYRETFDEVRLLTNFQLDDRNLLSVILMGQPELRRRLAHPVYEPLRQRIGMQYDLEGLEHADIGPYLDFRLETAGGRGGLFHSDAVERIYEYSRGIPRKINHAASLCLIEGFGRGSKIIDATVADAVMEELSLFE